MARHSRDHGSDAGSHAKTREASVEIVRAQPYGRDGEGRMNAQDRDIDLPIVVGGSRKVISAEQELFRDIGDEPNPDDRAGDDHEPRMFGDIMVFRGSHSPEGNEIGSGDTSEDAVPE